MKPQYANRYMNPRLTADNPNTSNKPANANPNPQALRTHILRPLGPKTILYTAFELILALG